MGEREHGVALKRDDGGFSFFYFFFFLNFNIVLCNREYNDNMYS